MYPVAQINLTKYKENLNNIISLTKEKNLYLAVVSKVFNGAQQLIDIINETEALYIGDSSLENIKNIRTNKKKMFLRISALSELKDVVKYADVSLQSELFTIKKLNEIAKDSNVIHEIILMFDLGDLREGIYYQDNYLKVVEELLNLSNIRLLGIGTNLTCYGGLIPTKEVLEKLKDIKENIEETFKFKLAIISGGNSSSLYLLKDNKLPSFINNLRLGESIVLGRETAYGKALKNMHDDVITVEAEIVEIKNKPSFPEGITGMDAFGNEVKIIDQGLMNRAILALGKQNVDCKDLIPINNIEIIGCSSDHLIVNIKDYNYKIGDKIKFKLTYGGILSVMTSPYVRKSYEK